MNASSAATPPTPRPPASPASAAATPATPAPAAPPSAVPPSAVPPSAVPAAQATTAPGRLLAVVVSDLHLGSPHFRADTFVRLLAALPPGVRLVVNGDTLDRPGQPLDAAASAALAALIACARRGDLVWVKGNHDGDYLPPGIVGVVPCSEYALARRLLVMHGHDFDNVMPQHQWFIVLFKFFHRWRVRLGARPVHVSHYAKRWPVLYGFLRRHVRLNALEHARERGFAAVTCGHVHYAEDTPEPTGSRYLNTGAWTEDPCHALVVYEQDLRLLTADALLTALAVPPTAPAD